MRLDCECGFVARGRGAEELVAVAQAHAHEAHLVDLTAEVILALAGMEQSPPGRLAQ
jgi:predicted small metal-binding protein